VISKAKENKIKEEDKMNNIEIIMVVSTQLR
jgi:hypothetical protein